MTFGDSATGSLWAKHVKGEPRNDFVIVVTASSRTPVSGTGKTTLALNLAKETDLSDSGFDANRKATLDAKEIAEGRIADLEDGSAIVWDEAQGTPGKEGLDARRAMKETSIQAINSILANRNKNFTLIIVAQQFSMLDSRLYPIIDVWEMIKEAPSSPDGPSGTAYRVYVQDYDLKNPDIRTEAIEDFSWRPIPHDDPDYQKLEELKAEAKTRNNSSNDDGELPAERQAERAKIVKDELDIAWRHVPDADHPFTKDITYSGSYLRKTYKDMVSA